MNRGGADYFISLIKAQRLWTARNFSDFSSRVIPNYGDEDDEDGGNESGHDN